VEQKKHIIIFSHGFGTRKDDRGLFTDIAAQFPEEQSILFNYNNIDETGEILTLTVPLLSEQAKMLEGVVRQAQTANPDTVIDIIAHSQGCLVTSLAQLEGIRKIIFLAPTFNAEIKHTINMFKNRPGTEINLSGVSRLVRKDGSFTMVPAEFWEERKKFEPIPFYNKLSSKTELIIINAKQDEVLGEAETGELDKKIKIIELDGNHQFSGDARKILTKEIKKILI
jgi:hypothetical protein